MPNYTPPPQAPTAPIPGVRPVMDRPLPPRNPNGSGFPDPGNTGSLEYAQQVAAAPGHSGEAQVAHEQRVMPTGMGGMAPLSAAPSAAPASSAMQSDPRYPPPMSATKPAGMSKLQWLLAEAKHRMQMIRNGWRPGQGGSTQTPPTQPVPPSQAMPGLTPGAKAIIDARMQTNRR